MIIPAFDPGLTLATIEAERVTRTLLVPTMLSLIVSHADLGSRDLSSLRQIIYGASPMPDDLLRQVMGAIPCEWAQAYGMTEASPLVTYLPAEDHVRGAAGEEPHATRLKSAGRPVFGVRVSVRRSDGTDAEPGEPGEIWVSGPNIMLGYWRRPEETAAALDADGWYRSGDAAHVDADGYVYIVDRVKDMIISGGENVYSTEVENALYSHPDVFEAAVFGVPDEHWGERVHAAVVLRPDVGRRRGRPHRALPAAHRRVQAAPVRRVPTTAAAQVGRRQDPQARAAATALGGSRAPGELTGGRNARVPGDRLRSPVREQRGTAPTEMIVGTSSGGDGVSTVSVQHHQMFIDGRAVDSPELYEIRSPATEELVCTMARARSSTRTWRSPRRGARSRPASGRNLPGDARATVMKRIAERLGTELEEFIEAEIRPNGATIRQATGFHVGLAAPHLLYFAELAATYEFERDIPTAAYPTLSMNRIRREPLGVCAAIVPWNFPLVLGIWKIGPALAAGNSVVVKVDEKTPLSLLRLAQVAHEEGVPDGVLNVISGDGAEVGARLASHPGVDKVAFTGSTAVGREIMRLASGTVKQVSLELGGKAPTILLDDADLDIAIDGALFGCMLYSGQICEAGTRLLVPEDMHDEFVARLVERARTIRLGDPADYDTDMGPVVSARQHERILGYLEQARADGATFALGGGVPAGADSPGATGSSRRSSRASRATCRSHAKRSSGPCWSC